MRRVTAILSTAAFVLAAAVVFAQAPNFAGKWAPDADKTPVKTVYNLDGSESKNMQQGRNGQTEVVSMAKWDGAKLVITTKGANGDQVTTWYMEGGDLVSERAGQNGPQKTYYKKG